MSSGYAKEKLLVQNCLAGDRKALALLQTEYLEPLHGVLIIRGASPTQASDLVANLWTDCVVSREGRPPLLEKYNGRSSLKTWIFKVGINMLHDDKRRAQRQGALIPYPPPDPIQSVFHETKCGEPETENGFVALLRESLQEAFDACPASALLQLRLIYVHDLTQKEVARMWGCHETTLARVLHRTLQFLADETVRAVRRRDPRLKLTWDDFVLLCDSERLDFL